jgi:hypothetical protein
MADKLFRILAHLDAHFAADDVLPADAARWRELKRRLVRMKDWLKLARIELESLGARGHTNEPHCRSTTGALRMPNPPNHA